MFINLPLAPGHNKRIIVNMDNVITLTPNKDGSTTLEYVNGKTQDFMTHIVDIEKMIKEGL